MLNGERRIAAWNDLKTVTITNVRLADAGIYECYEDGRRGQGQHAIMRLIVRGLSDVSRPVAVGAGAINSINT